MKKESKGVATFNEEREILITEREQQWSIRYQQLKEYFEKHQHCNVPQKYKEGSQLGRWVSNQRQLYKENKLSQEKIELLNQLNFNWFVVDFKWQGMYQQLKEYYEQHQNCNVTQKYKENPKLEAWVNTQRHYYKQGKLSQNKIDLLDQLNFVWDVYGDLWDVRYQQLREYYEQYQHCNVPSKCKENSSLGRWVGTQRETYKENRLSQERIDLLNELNFNWDTNESQWKEMYEQLKKYYGEYHHCNVPVRYKQNKSLGNWVATQRKNYRNNKISQERIDLLNELNFDWRN